MAVRTSIPNFEFSGFYYFEILRDILRYLRINVPEITDESDEEPFIQMARAWSLAHHYMNVRMDIVANETLLPTARLLESVRSQLKLIDFQLRAATPAQTQVVMEFSSLFTSPSTLIVPRNSQFATEDTDEVPQIIFEAVEDNFVSRTDRLTNVFVNLAVDITLSNKSGNLFDYVSANVPQEGDVLYQGGNYAIIEEIVDGDTIRLNTGTGIVNGAATMSTSNFGADKAGEAATDSLTFNFGSGDPRPGDLLYFIHDSAMWNRMDFVKTQLYKTGIRGVWEFFDGTFEDENPDEVTNLGPNLELDVTSLLGNINREGTKVQVQFAATASSEIVTSQWDGSKNIVRTTGLLGQTTPSTAFGDYLVGTIWAPLELGTNSQNDGNGEFSEDGFISYELPQSIKKNWAKATINGKTGFSLRFRVQEHVKTAATFTGSGFNPAGLDVNNFNIKIGIDGFADLEIDVTGDAGVSSGTYTGASVVAAINAALATLSATLNSVASFVNGQIVLTAPDDTLGKDSEIRVEAPSANDGTNEVFGLSETGYPYQAMGVGGIAILDRARIDEGAQFLLFDVVQGQTVTEEPLASSDGSPNQEYVLGFEPLIDGTLVIEVDEGSGFTAYDELENFLNADGARKAFRKETDANDRTVVFFGDGVNGKIPPAGTDNIRATYRIGADQNGNVGGDTIVVNLAGISFVNQVYNPRQASGWALKQGADESSLAAAKIEGPASLRTLGKAITPKDIETLANAFVSPTTGSSPVIRSEAIEETFGVKTVELLVVGANGALLNQTQRDELADYFNGNKVKDIDGVLVTNHEVTPVNYTPKPIDVEVIVTGVVEAEAVQNAIIALLNPEAKFDDNVTYRWEFGGEVPTSIIIAEIHDTDPVNVKKVNLISPATNVVLGARELPLPGNIQVTVVAPS